MRVNQLVAGDALDLTGPVACSNKDAIAKAAKQLVRSGTVTTA